MSRGIIQEFVLCDDPHNNSKCDLEKSLLVTDIFTACRM